VVLAIHKNGKDMLLNPKMNLSFLHSWTCKSQPADILLQENDLLKCGNLEFKIIHTPGHTPCGICLLLENNLFSGDTLFKHSIGRSDLPGGETEDLIKNIKEKLFILGDNTQVYPGHGESTSIKEEKIKNPFF